MSINKAAVTQSIEKRFTFNGFTYAAQLWGESDDLPVIALHGWLDNSASFEKLAPQLPGFQCLAMDLAGHGFSDHHSGFTDYPVWSEITAIFAIADLMGWQQFSLVGHSRGAMMAFLTAAVFPERISKLVLIDAIAPPYVLDKTAPKRVASSLQEIQSRLARETSLYPSYQKAINARCQSRTAPVLEPTAELLATRGLQKIQGQYHWHADGKLWAPSYIGLSEQMIAAFAHKLTDMDTLVILGEKGMIKAIPKDSDSFAHQQRIIEMMSAKVVYFDDGHFLHMEKSSEEVAGVISQFLLAANPSE